MKRTFMKLLGKLISPLISDHLGSVIRTLLAVGAGYLVAEGYATEEDATDAARANYELIIGILGALGVQIASIANKIKRK
jgi:hypothetical protein